MADHEDRRNEAALKSNGDVVASFRNVVTAGEHGLEHVPGYIKKILATGAWRERIERGKTLVNETFLEFITSKPLKGCAFKPEQIEALIKHDAETLAMWREAVTPEKHVHHDSIDNDNIIISQQGTSKSYTLDRLKREAPELFDRVCAGELSANAAAIQAGFRRKLTPFEQVERLIPKLTADERRRLKRLLAEG